MISITIVLLIINVVVSNVINGTNSITSHAYDNATVLTTNPVFCGIPGNAMDLTRITAVQNLSIGECGTCLKVTCLSSGGYVYVMAVDKGGIGLDLNQVSFKTLFGEDTGRFAASWAPVPAIHCKNILSDNYQVNNSNSTDLSDDSSDSVENAKDPNYTKYTNYTKDANDGVLVQKPNITIFNNTSTIFISSSLALTACPLLPLVILFIALSNFT